MKTIEYLVLDHEEHAAIHRIQPFAGYGLEDGPEREAEKKAIAMLGRRNDPITPEWFDAAKDGLRNLRNRLKKEADEEYLLESWGGHEENRPHAKLLAEERGYQHRLTREAYELLCDGYDSREPRR
jgi:hypothetical protein